MAILLSPKRTVYLPSSALHVIFLLNLSSSSLGNPISSLAIIISHFHKALSMASQRLCLPR
jgi:hypothetical protein